VSDDLNNPISEPAKISQDLAYAVGTDPAALSAETEGMPAAPEASAPVVPPAAEQAPDQSEHAIPPAEPVAETRDEPPPPAEAAAEVEPAQPAEVAAVEPARPAQPEPPVPEEPPEPKSDKMEWYILKVQSNREESIREGLLRRVAIAGLDRYFGDVIVPTEKVTEFKGGKKRVIKRKLYPGYLVVHMEINDDTWFLVRETPGIGDFTGAAGRPSVMLPHEVERIVAKAEEKSEKAPKLKIGFSEGERVKIKEGTFENFEGEVESIDQTNGQVTVMINIFGRSTPVTLEYWQIEAL
jgi:transcription termination/antitermination protein NusG